MRYGGVEGEAAAVPTATDAAGRGGGWRHDDPAGAPTGSSTSLEWC